jgi:hypothetical protein
LSIRAIAVATVFVFVRRAVTVAIIVDAICARRAVEGGIVIIKRCLPAYPALSLHVSAHSHPYFLIVMYRNPARAADTSP